jgi:hypothetical protein
MPLDVMKWRNYFCDDVMSGNNLWDRHFHHAAVPVNYTSELWELFEATIYFSSYTGNDYCVLLLTCACI